MKSQSRPELRPELMLSMVGAVIPLIARYLVWAWIALAHIALAVLALLTFWWTETSSADVAEFARNTLHSRPVAAMTLLGVSAISVATGYWKLLRWTHTKAGSWLIDTAIERLRSRG